MDASVDGPNDYRSGIIPSKSLSLETSDAKRFDPDSDSDIDDNLRYD